MGGGELQLLVKWKNSIEGEFVPSKIINIKYPQLVIQYYEGITAWGEHGEEKIQNST